MDSRSFIFAWDNFLSHFCFLEMRILFSVPGILSLTWTGWILFELRPLCLDFFPIDTCSKSVFECDNLHSAVWRSSFTKLQLECFSVWFNSYRCWSVYLFSFRLTLQAFLLLADRDGSFLDCYLIYFDFLNLDLLAFFKSICWCEYQYYNTW